MYMKIDFSVYEVIDMLYIVIYFLYISYIHIDIQGCFKYVLYIYEYMYNVKGTYYRYKIYIP